MDLTYKINKLGCLEYITVNEILASDIIDETISIEIPKSVNDKKISQIGLENVTDSFLHYFSNKVEDVLETVDNINFILPDGVEIINHLTLGSLLDCKITVNIPKTIKKIGSAAFQGANITAINFEKDSQLKIIGAMAFEKSTIFKPFILPASCETLEYKSFSKTNFVNGFEFYKNSKLETIYDRAFFGSDFNVENLYFPDSLKLICDHAFYCCNNLSNIYFSSNSEVEIIGNSAFELSSINNAVVQTIASTLSMGSYCFAACDELENLNIKNSPLTYIPDHFCATCYNLKNIKLPQSINKICEFAFYETGLEEFEIPENVSFLEKRCFCNSNLRNVNFLNVSKIEKIGDSAFEYCKLESLPSNIFSNVKDVGELAFSSNNFTSLTLNAFSEDVNFGYYVFSNNKKLKKICLINNKYEWKEIFSAMFEGCENLSDISIPNSVENICFGGFRNTAITSISLPLKKLGKYAFANCKELVSCDFSNGDLKEIYTRTFYKASKIKEIKLSPFSQAEVSYDAFYRFKDKRLHQIFRASPFIKLI